MIESNLGEQGELVVVQMFIAMAVAAKSPNLVQSCFGTSSDCGRRSLKLRATMLQKYTFCTD